MKHNNEVGEGMASATQTARGELADRWPIVLAAFLGVAGGVSSLPYYTQGVFVRPLTDNFGWTREQMSLVTLVGGMLLAVLSPFVGNVVDRIGTIYPLVCSFCVMIVGYIALAMIGPSFTIFFLLQLFLIGGGAATGPVSFTRIINEHFRAARGLALGITLSGAGIMAIIAPPLLAYLIARFNWRAGYLAVAILVFVSAFCSISLLLHSRRPEPSIVTPASDDLGPSIPSVSRAFICRLAITFLLMALGVGGFTFHLVPMLVDAGLDLSSAAKIQSLIGLALLIGRLSAGALMDRIFAPYVAAGVVLSAAIGIAGLALAGVPAAAPCAFLIGLALGSEGDIIGYLTARYFGMRVYGRIYGLLYGLFAFGLGLSPVLMSRLQAMSHSYTTSLWLSFAALLGAVFSLVSLPSFPKRD